MWLPSTCTDRGLRSFIRGLAAASLLMAAPAPAATLEKLLMPGPLTSAHAKYEDDCSQCHGKSIGKSENIQCLACHDKVAVDVRQKHGFHGRSPQLVGKECRQCHSEHQGRNADIIGLVPALFEHGHTDFPLEGAHRGLTCDGCHAKGKPFRDTPSACVDCHKKDDIHKDQMGKQCQDCHSAEVWRQPRFDHSKTRFPLRAAHQKVDCASCHPGQKYKGVPTSCAGCHKLQDPHGGLFGSQCADCHGEKDWKLAHYDHDRVAEFPLRGRHAKLDCHACHTEKMRGRKLETTCYGCHKGSDIHQGRLGRQCADCHSTEGWSKKGFDHDKDTQFPLRGPHRKATCEACHAEPAKKGAAVRACVDCHRADDTHRGQLGDRCDNCHQIEGWSSKVNFEHDLTRFPLMGLHALVPCGECHLSGDYKSTPKDCKGCHAARDVHKDAMGARCDSCHSTAGWTKWTFDHDRQTGFPLENSHRNLRCQDCHREPAGRGGGAVVERSCGNCHATDDIHRGGFGSDCGRCHSTTRFSEVQVRRTGPQPK